MSSPSNHERNHNVKEILLCCHYRTIESDYLICCTEVRSMVFSDLCLADSIGSVCYIIYIYITCYIISSLFYVNV